MNEVRLLVVHWNQPEACAATVRALCAQGIPLRATVIDNHSDAAEFARLQANLEPSVGVVRLEENRGWGGALNVLLRRWLSEESESFCIISAHDAMPADDCLRLLLAAMAADRRVGFACPQYTEPYVVRLSRWRGIFPASAVPQAPGVAQEVDAPHGTLMIARRECLHAIGLFDERYFAYGDEHELGARATRRGWKLVMVWGAVVVNPGTDTASSLRSYLFARNSLLLVREFFGPAAAACRAILLVGNTLRLGVSRRARWQAVRDYFRGRFGKPSLR